MSQAALCSPCFVKRLQAVPRQAYNNSTVAPKSCRDSCKPFRVRQHKNYNSHGLGLRLIQALPGAHFFPRLDGQQLVHHDAELVERQQSLKNILVRPCHGTLVRLQVQLRQPAILLKPTTCKSPSLAHGWEGEGEWGHGKPGRGQGGGDERGKAESVDVGAAQ